MGAGQHVRIVRVYVLGIRNFKRLDLLDWDRANRDVLVFVECSGGHLKGETILAHAQYECVSDLPRQ